MSSSFRWVGFVVVSLVTAGACGDGELVEDEQTGSGGAGATAVASTQASGTTGPVVASSSSGGTGGALTCEVPYTDLAGECDLLAQDCPAGKHCAIGGDGTVCAGGSGGLKTVGMECTGGECQAGLNCQGGHCTPYCCPETDEPCGDGTCDLHVSFNAGYVMMCSFNPGCLLFEGNCPDGKECHIGDAAAGLAVCDDPSKSAVEESQPCIFRNDCGESQICNKNDPDKDGDKGRCRHLCKASAWEGLEPSKGGCLPGRTCKKVNAGTFVDLGICLETTN